MPFEIVRNDITNMRVDANHVIHAVSPIWQGGGRGEKDLLKNCYETPLNLLKSMASTA